MQKVTFTPLSRGRYRLNQPRGDRPVIVKKASVDRVRRVRFNELNPRKPMPAVSRSTKPRLPVVTAARDVFFADWVAQCPQCGYWNYPNREGDFPCTLCKAEMEIRFKK